MEISGTQDEARLLYLEKELARLRRMLDSVANVAKDAKQKADQGNIPGGGSDGTLFRFQIISAVSVTSGATLGTGTGRLLTVISGKRYNKTDGTAGHYTDADLYNDTGGTVPINTFVVAGLVNGLMTILVADCVTASPAACTDDITA